MLFFVFVHDSRQEEGKIDVYSRVNIKIKHTHTHTHTHTKHGKYTKYYSIYHPNLFGQLFYPVSPRSFTVVQFAKLTIKSNA